MVGVIIEVVVAVIDVGVVKVVDVGVMVEVISDTTTPSKKYKSIRMIHVDIVNYLPD